MTWQAQRDKKFTELAQKADAVHCDPLMQLTVICIRLLSPLGEFFVPLCLLCSFFFSSCCLSGLPTKATAMSLTWVRVYNLQDAVVFSCNLDDKTSIRRTLNKGR